MCVSLCIVVARRRDCLRCGACEGQGITNGWGTDPRLCKCNVKVIVYIIKNTIFTLHVSSKFKITILSLVFLIEFFLLYFKVDFVYSFVMVGTDVWCVGGWGLLIFITTIIS